MKNKTTAGLFAIFLGGLGIHRFYLNQIGFGILYLLFCWTLIPSIIGFIDGLVFLSMDDSKFNLKYNPTALTKIFTSTNTPVRQDFQKQEAKQTQESTSIAIQQPTIEVVELNAIEKLQFKKFIAEQSGMNINDVDNYIESITESEKIELIKTFKATNKAIQIQPTQAVVPTIKVVQENDSLPSCPKCKSKQVTFNKQGFGFGKAIIGGVLTGGVGLLAGGINKNKILLTCLKCGHKWKRG